MDKLAYHLNKKKKLAKTEGKFLYYYPCDAEDNPNVWFGPKAYIVIEVGEKEWEALFELDRLEYNNTHKYQRHTNRISNKYEDELIKFKPKEINSMPDYLKKLFTINDKIVTYRYVDGLYQARFRRDGYNIEVASKSFDIMRQKFLDKLLATEKAKQNAGYPLFADFINDWLKVKKQTVKETTYKSYVNLLTHNILPKFGHYHVNEITRKDIQDFLFELTDNGKNRTAQKLKLLLSAIFDVIVEDYNIKTPMSKIVLSHYEVKKGKAFTKAEEKTIIDFCKENPQYAGNSALLVCSIRVCVWAN